MNDKHKSPFRRWYDFTWRGPSIRTLAIVVLVVILGLSAVLVAGIAGFRQGMADLVAASQAEVEQHIAKGVAQMEAGLAGLARVEFETALNLDPNNAQARQYLEALQSGATAIPTPIPSAPAPMLVPPEAPTPPAAAETTASTAVSTFQLAQDAMQAKNYAVASEVLEELAALDPAFRADEVEQMRFDAAYQQGLALLADNSPEEALRAFDQALAIRPKAADARTQRELAALYSNALGSWKLDWPAVVENLQTIYRRQPDFLDVGERLATAQESWGDSLAKAGQWCDAADRYAAAGEVESSSQLGEKKTQADAFCLQAPTATVTATVAAQTTAVAEAGGARNGSGRVAFATFSPDFNRWTLYRLPMQGNAQPVQVAEGASEPDVSPNGNRIAVRSELGDQGGVAVMDSDGTDRIRVTTFYEDAHPSWSPDGGQLVFESNREGDRLWRIYRTSAGGGGDTMLTYGRWPTWAPQGKSVAYQGCNPSGNQCGLWVMDADGSNGRPVTNVPGDAMPAWSPDGARLAFASADRGGGWDVYLLDVATGNVSTVASSPGIDAHPTWSPDGRQVAILSNRSGPWAIYVVDVTSGGAQQALVLPGTLPDWYEASIAWGK